MDGSRKLKWRPIILAARYGNKDVVELLLKHGANPDLPAPRDAPCYHCTPRCRGTTGRCRTKLTRGSRAVHYAVVVERLDLVTALLRAGADPNVADFEGITPLMVACDKGPPNIEVVKELLEAGADPARISKRGATALWCAAFRGSTDIVGMLLSRAPETLNHTTFDGWTALYSAAIDGNTDVVVFLLAAGAKQPTTYDRFRCPLNASVQEGRVEVVRVLLGRGLEAIGGAVAIPAALAKAMHGGRAAILQMILDAAHEVRPESWATCGDSNRPLVCCAVSHGHLSALSVLLAAGADATAMDSKGKSAQEIVRHGALKCGPATRAAFDRMLERAPAFRGYLWTWPVDEHNGSGHGVLSLIDEVALRAPLGVQIFRLKHSKRCRLLARVIGATCSSSTKFETH